MALERLEQVQAFAVRIQQRRDAGAELAALSVALRTLRSALTD